MVVFSRYISGAAALHYLFQSIYESICHSLHNYAIHQASPQHTDPGHARHHDLLSLTPSTHSTIIHDSVLLQDPRLHTKPNIRFKLNT